MKITKIKQSNLRKLISYIILEKYGSEIYIFKVGSIRKELKDEFKVNVELDRINKIIDQHLRKGVIKFATDYEYTKQPCSRDYKISIPTDILKWFLAGKSYGDSTKNNK